MDTEGCKKKLIWACSLYNKHQINGRYYFKCNWIVKWKWQLRGQDIIDATFQNKV